MCSKPILVDAQRLVEPRHRRVLLEPKAVIALDRHAVIDLVLDDLIRDLVGKGCALETRERHVPDKAATVDA